jgi:hypothetical protein
LIGSESSLGHPPFIKLAITRSCFCVEPSALRKQLDIA